MAKRITVSVPDMLHEKMEQWRESFNMSKMFQDAVAEAIKKKEEFQRRMQTDPSMEEIIERLRNEKAEYDQNISELGKQEGLRWAKSAHYDELIYAVNWPCQENPLDDPVLGEYFSTSAANFRKKYKIPEQFQTNLKAFTDAWKTGVVEFWDEVKDKL